MCQCSCSTESAVHGSQQCGCGGHDGFHRRFVSPAEEKERLESYREGLKNELAGVEARIREITVS